MKRKRRPLGKLCLECVILEKRHSKEQEFDKIIVFSHANINHTLNRMFFFSPSPSPEDLSELLAAGTKEVHEKAENTQFVKDFLRGRIRKELFKVSLKRNMECFLNLECLENCSVNIFSTHLKVLNLNC